VRQRLHKAREVLLVRGWCIAAKVGREGVGNEERVQLRKLYISQWAVVPFVVGRRLVHHKVTAHFKTKSK